MLLAFAFGPSGLVCKPMAAKTQARQGASWSNKLKFYVVVMGGYYAYKYYKMQGKSPDEVSGTSSKGAGAAYECKDGSEHMHRQFEKIGGSWVSSMQAGACSDNQLLLLHRTSLSAETEFASLIPQLITKAAPSGGLQVIAPDRPCHGYTPCSAREDTLERLVARRPGLQQFSYLASGRESIQQALDIAKRRRTPTKMLLLRPMMVEPDTKGVTAPVGVDSARWAALSSDRKSSPGADGPEPLSVAQMPRGCVVTLVYLDGDKEDEAFKTALEEEDVAVDVRYVDSLEDELVPAVTDMLAGDGASAAEASDEEV